MRAAIPEVHINRLLKQKFVPLIALDKSVERENQRAESYIKQYNHYLEKEVVVDLRDLADEEIEIKKLLTAVKGNRQALVLDKRSIEVSRFVKQRHARFSNILSTVLKNNLDRRVNITISSVFDSHQYCFLSGIAVRDTKTNVSFEDSLAARYTGKAKKPHGNNPITTVEVTFFLEAGQEVELLQPYLVNIRKISEYEQEYERGTAILGGVVVAYSGPKGELEVHPLSPIQADEKLIDSTFAFTTLTVNNLIFFMVPVSLMAYGINAYTKPSS